MQDLTPGDVEMEEGRVPLEAEDKAAQRGVFKSLCAIVCFIILRTLRSHSRFCTWELQDRFTKLCKSSGLSPENSLKGRPGV